MVFIYFGAGLNLGLSFWVLVVWVLVLIFLLELVCDSETLRITDPEFERGKYFLNSSQSLWCVFPFYLSSWEYV